MIAVIDGFDPVEADKPRTRQEFATSIANVKGWSGLARRTREKEILAILGKPDDVRTHADPGGIATTGTKEIWCYGTKGHLTFPTLGCVYIDTQGRAQYVYGGGNPPSPGLFKEGELRDLLCIIDTVPILSGQDYNPLPMIQIVNTLVTLPKDKALAAIEEYLRIAPGFRRDTRQGMILLLRTLFELPQPPGYMPYFYGVQPWPNWPNNREDIPCFPLWLVDDVPLMLVSSFASIGLAEPAQAHVDYFRKHGRLRARPLSPTNSPLQLLDLFAKHYLRLYSQDPDSRNAVIGKTLIINQLLRLVDSVSRVETDVYGRKFSGGRDIDERWKQITNEFAKLDIRWDAKQNKYTFKDGSSLPDLPVKHYRREIWKLDRVTGDGKVVVQRIHKGYIRLELTWSGPRGSKIEPGSLRLYVVNAKSAALAEIGLASLASAAMDGSDYVDSSMIELSEGQHVQIELVIGNTSARSSIYKP
jgi:hypothetical protein